MSLVTDFFSFFQSNKQCFGNDETCTQIFVKICIHEDLWKTS